MNNELKIKEISWYNDLDEKFASDFVAYKTDANGYLVYDYKVDRKMECEESTDNCVEKVVVTNYSNINRIYINPNYKPTDEVKVEFPNISAHQLGTSNAVQINFSENCPEQLVVVVKDIQGNIKSEKFLVSRDNNTIYLNGNMKIGVHLITPVDLAVKSCTFMYIP